MAKVFHQRGWKIENGVISVDPSNGRGGDIITDQEYSDFELSLNLKLQKEPIVGLSILY